MYVLHIFLASILSATLKYLQAAFSEGAVSITRGAAGEVGFLPLLAQLP